MKEKAPLNVQIGKRIRQIRKDRKLTQEELSFKLAIDVQTMSNIERGVTGIKTITLYRLCRELSLSSDAIVFGERSRNETGDLAGRLRGLTQEQFHAVQELAGRAIDTFGMLRR